MSRWEDLKDSLDEMHGRTIERYAADENERDLYCEDCEAIIFLDTDHKPVWKTEGSGQMKLPPQVSVMVKRGKSMCI